MSEQALISKIKQRGYWKVSISPSEYIENRFDYSELKGIIDKCRVSLRGWDYPHLDQKNICNRSGYIESYCEFDYLIEYWRFYRSGKFIHLFGMREDGRKESPVLQKFHEYGNGTPPTGLRGLSIISSIYSLTEIFEFGIRLGKHGVLNSGSRVTLELFGLKDRMLYFENFFRDLRQPYISRDDYFKQEAAFSSVEHITATGHDMALKWFNEIAQQFQWDSLPKGAFAEDQKKFLERRQ